MTRSIYLTMIALLTVAGLAGCDDCGTEPNVPDPSVGEATEIPAPTLGDRLGEPRNDNPSPDNAKPGPAEPTATVREAPSLEQAFAAPDDAVTSEGRFSELMEQGLAEHLPPIGLAFASGGVDRPTTRVIVTTDGTARWARGQGQFWDEFDDTGEVDLGEKERKKLSDLVARAWTEEDLEYPPTAANQGELLVLRDGDTARVIEGSKLPEQLWPLRDLLLSVAQPTRP